MKNADMPVMPIEGEFWVDSTNPKLGTDAYLGLTKRETFCLHLGVPETGDPELDEIIRKGDRNKSALGIISGFACSPNKEAFIHALAVLNALIEDAETKNPA